MSTTDSTQAPAQGFPSLAPESVFDRVRKVWDIDTPFPMLRDDVNLSCPVCGQGEWQYRLWRFFERNAGGARYRCDVSLKCTVCSVVQLFGIPVPEEVFEMQHERAKPIHWREVKANIMSGTQAKGGRWQTVEPVEPIDG